MKKQVRSPGKRTLDQEKLRPVPTHALARVLGGSGQVYPATEYDAIPIPRFDEH